MITLFPTSPQDYEITATVTTARQQRPDAQAPLSQQAIGPTGNAVTLPPMAPVVPGIHPAVAKSFLVAPYANAQAAFFDQHMTLNARINLLREQQPTFEGFLAQHRERFANTPGSPEDVWKHIAAEFGKAVVQFWTTRRPTEDDPSAPQDQLMSLHREMLSNQAALRVTDGTLSGASKKLIDSALRYPTLAAREAAFPAGSRPGVYPITVDDCTPNGARLAGAFMITSKDGSSATAPHWPEGGRNILADELNGPVVLYTPSEGFEEFATPAQLQYALAQRINEGGVPAKLLAQSLPLSVENLRQPLDGDDLTLGFFPGSEDIIAQAVPQLLQRQAAEIQASVERLNARPGEINGGELKVAMNDAANWSAQFDGTNAMLARGEKLAEKQQPQWLKDLSLLHEGHYQDLERAEQTSLQSLVPLLEDIPSLQAFAKEQLSAELKKKYPTVNFDSDKITVKVTHQSRNHSGQRQGVYTPRNVDIAFSSLTDLSLKNPTVWPAAESHRYSIDTMSAELVDAGGKPLLGANGQPIFLQTDELKTLVNTLDVGGHYVKLLKARMAPDAVTGEPAMLRAAWKANLADVMNKQAFLAQLNPQSYPQDSQAVEWVQTVLDHPDPATRPQVDGKNIVANTVSARGLALQGVLAISAGEDGPLVLYSPDAPDGVSFREVASQAALEALFDQPQWKTYAQSKTSPINPDSLAQLVNDVQDKNIINIVTRLLKAKELKSRAYLKPIQGNFQDAGYKQLTQVLIDKADFSSVSSDEVAKESRVNKALFGIEVASVFIDILPVIGKGASSAARLTKNGLKMLRAPGRAVANTLNKPNHLATIYARQGGVATDAKAVSSPVLRVVPRLTAPSRFLEPVPTNNLRPLATSRAQNVVTARALPDFSRHSLPDSLLSGRAIRGDGTYQIGEQFYIRYTDGTGVRKPYEISPIYKIEGGPVRLIDPTSKKTVAFLNSAGDGEWRVSRLPGAGRTEQVRSQGLKRPFAQETISVRPSSSGMQPVVFNSSKRPRVPESFPGEKAQLDSPVKGKNVFYHYTGKKNHAGILASNNLSSSSSQLTGEALPRGKGRHYFTDLAPTDKPTVEISETIFGRRKYGNALDKMTHYYEVNTSGLTMVQSPTNPHIFYVDTPFDLPLKYRNGGTELSNRIISHGETAYMPR